MCIEKRINNSPINFNLQLLTFLVLMKRTPHVPFSLMVDIRGYNNAVHRVQKTSRVPPALPLSRGKPFSLYETVELEDDIERDEFPVFMNESERKMQRNYRV